MDEALKQPKLIFSFNTFPITNSSFNLKHRLKDIMYMMSLSILYCCKWFDNVEVYVDDFAYNFLKELPCKVSLMTFKEAPKIWMRSKIEVIEKQNEPFIHIDNDVFIKEKIDLSFDNLLFERRDVAKYNYNVLISFFENYASELNYWKSDIDLIPSCGLLGFANMDLKDKFIKSFYNFEMIFNKYQNEYQEFISRMHKIGEYSEICLLMEQYNLGCLIDSEKIVPKFVLEGKSEAEQSKFANKIGFTHLYGTSKYSKKIIKRIHFLFETNFPEYYKLLSKKIIQQL